MNSPGTYRPSYDPYVGLPGNREWNSSLLSGNDGGARNVASDPTWIARQQWLAWEDHLRRIEWLKRMAIAEIKRQPFFGTV